jgi:hypothetical protein
MYKTNSCRWFHELHYAADINQGYTEMVLDGVRKSTKKRKNTRGSFSKMPNAW